ncbi:MAG: ABC transporter ATP-binding protein [Lachnospiraceae bacterium]|nr:ABC transporter ATP-binding protein [Lachnospiraceae bacterium]
MKSISLRTENLTAGYGRSPILTNVTLTVNPGQILTLIGPNGAGKSTLLRTISMQLAPMAGSVYLGKESIHEMSPNAIARSMSLLLTDRIDPELMTCRDLVETGRYPYTGRLGILSGEDRTKADEALALVHAQEIADRPFRAVSDGQRQRILLARALCQDPGVLVLDEPTSYLDIRHKLELLGLLRKLVREKNISVIMSLHEIDLAQKISDFILCLKDGKIDKCGTPEEIFHDDYIKNLFGIEQGCYLTSCGSPELPKNPGKPEIFVIGGGGSAISTYRKLHRQGIAFAAGILHENDLEYPIACALANEVVAEKAFEPISDASFHRARALAASCKEVICCLKEFGTLNARNKELL